MDDLKERLPQILSEVYAILVALGEKYINKLPVDVWEDIIRLKDNSYSPFVDEDVAMHEQGLMEDSIMFMAMLKLDYFCDTEEKKQELLSILDGNEARWNAKMEQTDSIRGKLKIVADD